MKVFILGAGKVGRALAKALKKAGDVVTLRPARKGAPRGQIDADVVILSVRDRELAPLGEALKLHPRAVCVHNAGSLGPEALASIRGKCAGVAQMHPMISFASTTFFPTLARGNCHIRGDAAAEKKARILAGHLGLTPRTFPKLDPVGYHAAAGLVANGTAALAALGAELLVKSGVPRADAPKLLGPLLRSVAENVEALGFPAALTGPIRRGDAAGITKAIKVLEARLPEALPLFRASGVAQLPLARTIGDAPAKSFDDVEAALTAE